MTPPWGINWLRYHPDNRRDMAHIAAAGYRAFTLYEWMWSDRDFCNELAAAARDDAIFLARDHPLSEQKDERWKNDPYGKGRAHADEWAAKVQQGRVYTPLSRTYFLGINEPDSNYYPRQIDAYNEAFCDRLAEHGLRAAAYSFGVGHPSTVDLRSDTDPDWSHYQASARAVREGHHIAAFHEYGAPGGYGWGYWCNRLRHCPHAFDVVLDECGIDNGVVNAGELYGWAQYMGPDEYLEWLDGFQRGMAERADTRKVNILAYNIFCYDHGRGDDKDWHSFSILPLIGKIERYDWTQPTDPNVARQTNKHKTHLPNIPGGNAQPSGADPAPQPDDKWQRSLAFVRKWEGGWADNPVDPGGATNKGITFRTFKAWRKAKGRPEPTKDDLRNLSDEEQGEILYEWYWLPSGADALPWPDCLGVFDLAINGGVGRVDALTGEVGTALLPLMGRRLQWYTNIDGWEHFGKGWVRRCADLLQVAAG